MPAISLSSRGDPSASADDSTSGAPLIVSRVPVSAAANGRPDWNGRNASRVGSSCGPAASWIASSVACSTRCLCREYDVDSAACRTCASVYPVSGRTAFTCNRFSLSVPVLSKHTTSRRASASTECALRIEHRLAGQPARRRQLRQRGHQRQALGNGRDGQRHRAGDRFAQRCAAQHAEQPDQRPAGEAPGQGPVGDAAQLSLQADLAGLRRRHGQCAAHLGHRPDRGDDGQCRAGHHRGAVVDHAGALGQRRARRRVGLLGHRQRFAGQGGLVDLEVAGLEQSGVGRHHLTGAHLDDVAGPKSFGRDVLAVVFGQLADPAAGERVLHGHQAPQDAFGVQLLFGGERGVGQQHAADEHGVQRRAEQCAGHRAGREDRGDRIGQVAAHLVDELARQRPGGAAGLVQCPDRQQQRRRLAVRLVGH